MGERQTRKVNKKGGSQIERESKERELKKIFLIIRCESVEGISILKIIQGLILQKLTPCSGMKKSA